MNDAQNLMPECVNSKLSKTNAAMKPRFLPSRTLKLKLKIVLLQKTSKSDLTLVGQHKVGKSTKKSSHPQKSRVTLIKRIKRT